jgi:hypothetical protein
MKIEITNKTRKPVFLMSLNEDGIKYDLYTAFPLKIERQDCVQFTVLSKVEDCRQIRTKLIMSNLALQEDYATDMLIEEHKRVKASLLMMG